MKAAPARRTGRSSWRISAGPSETVGLFLAILVRVAADSNAVGRERTGLP
jgi:hypothetical protein